MLIFARRTLFPRCQWANRLGRKLLGDLAVELINIGLVDMIQLMRFSLRRVSRPSSRFRASTSARNFAGSPPTSG